MVSIGLKLLRRVGAACALLAAAALVSQPALAARKAPEREARTAKAAKSTKSAKSAKAATRTAKASSRKPSVQAARKAGPGRVAARSSRVSGTVRTTTSSRSVPARSTSRQTVVARKPLSVVRRAAPIAAMAPVSYGQAYGLRDTSDPLALSSSVALVLDQDTNEVLFSKNPQAVLPIASLTKLMTALVVVEAHQSLDEVLTITEEDIDTEKFSGSRLAVGTRLTRENMLHLALMSSENRAANALGRHYPGGLPAFVAAMNRKAQELGMWATRYVEPTGLSSRNQSSAHDLAVLVKAAYRHTLIRELSTSHEYQVAVGSRHLQYHNTNGLVRSPSWDIGLQKTGYIAEAGRCLVMQARLAGRKLIMVFLDSSGKYSRQADAERVRRWLESAGEALRPTANGVPRVTS
jgi:D-alanyl-D-alanine endopeptidase (penicillin-binding protein 7)